MSGQCHVGFMPRDVSEQDYPVSLFSYSVHVSVTEGAEASINLDCRTDILAGSVDGTLRRFDVRTGHLITDLLHHPITSVGSTKDFKCVLACCTDSCIRVLSREGGNLLGTYRGHLHSYSRIEATFTPSDAHIVGCSEDGKIYYWDVLSSQIETCFQAHDAEVTSLSIHPKGDFLLTSSTEGCIKLWKK